MRGFSGEKKAALMETGAFSKKGGKMLSSRRPPFLPGGGIRAKTLGVTAIRKEDTATRGVFWLKDTVIVEGRDPGAERQGPTLSQDNQSKSGD